MNDQAAVDTVISYLRLVEERRLGEASRSLAPEPVITFPGGRLFTDLEAQVVASVGRYRRVRKTFGGFDVIGKEGVVVVYVFGELEGEDVTGRPFAGVRFIDRFELVGGLIADHRVWNDLAEVMGVDPGDDGRSRELTT